MNRENLLLAELPDEETMRQTCRQILDGWPPYTAWEQKRWDHLCRDTEPDEQPSETAEEKDLLTRFNIATRILEDGYISGEPIPSKWLRAAVDELLELSEGGYWLAQAHLAYEYETGRFLPPDPAAARHWYEMALPKAVENRFDGVCISLVKLCYYGGEGLARDKEAAFRFLEMVLAVDPTEACDAGIFQILAENARERGDRNAWFNYTWQEVLCGSKEAAQTVLDCLPQK